MRQGMHKTNRVRKLKFPRDKILIMSRVYSIILSLAALVLALDQWTKQSALTALGREGDSIPVLSWFHFTLVHNHAAAFGVFHGIPEGLRVGFLMLLPLAVLTLLWWFFVRKMSPVETLAPVTMGLVVGGAIGNLIDRICFGFVIDFIDWFYPSKGSCLPLFFPGSTNGLEGSCHWPVFNVADSAISIAMVLLVITSFLDSKNTKTSPSN